ncbi:MAG: hypothetical protein WC223_05745 [Bacteroidales bacterium]|jgi:hypothetical protein
MKNDLENIDKFFKGGLENYRVEPGSGLLKGVKKDLFLKKILTKGFLNGTNLFLFEIVDILIIFSFCATTYFSYNAKSNVNTAYNKVLISRNFSIKNSSNETNHDAIQKKAVNATFSNNAKGNNTENIEIERNEGKQSAEKSGNLKAGKEKTKTESAEINTESKTTKNEKNIKKQSGKANEKPFVAGNTEKKKMFKETKSTAGIDKTNNNETKSRNSNSSTNKKNVASTKTSNKKPIIKTNTITNNIPNTNNITSKENNEKTNNPNEVSNQQQPQNNLPAENKKSQKDTLTNVKSDSTSITQNNPPLPADYVRKNKFSVDIYGSPFCAINTLSSVEFKDYINKIKEYEKPALSYSFGAEAKYNIKKFFIKSGINYSEYITKSKFSINKITGYDTSKSFLKIDTIGYDSTNQNLPMLDSNWKHISSPVSKDENIKSINSLRYFEIPLLIGYEFGKNKFTLRVTMGASVAFYLSSKGKIISTDLKEVVDFNKNYFPFQSNFFNFICRLGFCYKLNDKISIVAEPSFNCTFNSIFKNSFGINQKIKSAGLNAGVNFKF